MVGIVSKVRAILLPAIYIAGALYAAASLLRLVMDLGWIV